jgi:cell division protein FtsQ
VNFFSKSKKKNKKLKKRVFIGTLSKLNFFRNVPENFYFKIGWIGLLTIVLFLCFLALNRPIELINVSGDLKRVPLKSIENNTNNLRNKGFLSFNASEVKEKIESLDWVQSAEIIRVWPNPIDIKITEESLLGLWNDDLILNSSGKLYVVDKRSVPTNIPRLIGPKGSEKDVMNLFIQINNLLTGRGLYLETLTLDARGSWSFTIKPKIEIKLGKTEINQKLERLFLALDQSLLAKINKVSYIDLRYSEGLAVAWKK